jgi:hypothetical protein
MKRGLQSLTQLPAVEVINYRYPLFNGSVSFPKHDIHEEVDVF